MVRSANDAVPGEPVALFMHVLDQDNKNLVDPTSIKDVGIYSQNPLKNKNLEPILVVKPEKVSLGTFFIQFTIPIDWCAGRMYSLWDVDVQAQNKTTVQVFQVLPRTIILDPDLPSLVPDESPRVTLLTKEALPGELKRLAFVLSKPVNTPLPPTEIQVSQGRNPLTKWEQITSEGNQGYFLVQIPEEVRPGILKVQFRLHYGEEQYLTPYNDLRIIA